MGAFESSYSGLKPARMDTNNFPPEPSLGSHRFPRFNFEGVGRGSLFSMTAKSENRLMCEASIALAVVHAVNLLSEESLMRVPLLPETPNRAHIEVTLSGLALEFSRMNFEENQQ
jgi:hypothetical protein